MTRKPLGARRRALATGGSLVAVVALVGGGLALGESNTEAGPRQEPVLTAAGPTSAVPNPDSPKPAPTSDQQSASPSGKRVGPAAAATSAGKKKRATGPSRKLSSGLLTLATEPDRSVSSAQTAAALGLPAAGPGSLMVRPGNAVLATVGGVTGPERLAALAATGTKIVNRSFRYGLATVAVEPRQLMPVARISGVTSVREVLQPTVARVGATARTAVRSSASACAPVKSEADTQLKGALAKAQFGVDGTGATVGILSDSFGLTSSPTTVAQDVASGNLPGPGNPCGHTTAVAVLDEYAPAVNDSAGTDEGRAMTQLVHHAAPGATLKFATAFNGELGFANNIRALAAAGAKIIVDDVGYFDEPMFQDGIVAQAINDVTADGVIYLTSAGNSNVIVGGNNVASVEVTNPVSARSCPAAVVAYVSQPINCVGFSALDVGAQYTVAQNKSLAVTLQWNQPWNGVATDYDLFILNQAGDLVLDLSDHNSPQEGVPFEFAGWKNNTGSAAQVQVVVARYSGPDVRLKYVINSDTNAVTAAEYATTADGLVVGPTVFGHSGSRSATTAAAARFDDGTQAEWFSSRGPVTHYFGPVVDGTPAAALGSPDVISKPDITGTDGDCTTFFYANQVINPPTCPYRFYGTSAAAPNVAAVAALLTDANPALTGAQLRTLITGNPTAMTGGANAVGAGLANAQAAISAAGRVPRGLTPPSVAAGVGSVAVTFNPPTITGSTAIIDYRATCSSPGHATGTATGISSPLTVGDLSIGSAYTCAVEARNSVGFGPPSRASAQVKPVAALIAPMPPTGVSGRRGNSVVTVSWRAPADNGSPAPTAYRATASPGGRICTTASGPVLSCVVRGLTNGTNYTFTVVATNGVGSSAPSSPSSGVRPATSPAAPRALKAKYAKAKARIRWAEPANNGGLPVTSYRYRVSKNNGRSWTSWRSSGRSTAAAVTRKRKLAYQIQVRAVNPVGAGSVRTLKLRKYR